MIRTVECLDFDGAPYRIKAIKHDFLSKFELLLPERYRLVYSGCEWGDVFNKGRDLDVELMKINSFRHKITVINLDAKPIPLCESRMKGDDSDKDIEVLKYTAANCLRACIWLKGDNSLDTVVYYYNDQEDDVNDEMNTLEQALYLISEEYICEEYLLREEY